MSAYKLRKPPIHTLLPARENHARTIGWAALALVLTLLIFFAAKPPSPLATPLVAAGSNSGVSMPVDSPRMSLSKRLDSIHNGATRPAGVRNPTERWWRELPGRLILVLAAVGAAFALGWRSHTPDRPVRLLQRAADTIRPVRPGDVGHSRKGVPALRVLDSSGTESARPEDGPAPAAHGSDIEHSVRLRNLLAEKTGLITELEARFSAHREEQADLRQRAETAQAEAGRAAALDLQLEQRTQECLSLQEQIDELETHCHTLENSVCERDEHLVEMQELAREELQSRDRITLELDASKHALAAAQTRAQVAEEALATRNGAVAGLEARIAERDETICQHAAQVHDLSATLKAERLASGQEHANMRQDNAGLRARLDALQEDQHQVQLLCDASRNELEILRDAQTQREETLCELSAAHEEVLASYRRCGIERDDLALALDERDQRIAALEYDLIAQQPALTQARADNDALRLTLRNARGAVAGLENRIADRARQLAAQRARIEALEETLAATRAERVALAVEVDARDRKLVAQQHSLRTLEERVEAAAMYARVLESALRTAGTLRCEQESTARALTERLNAGLVTADQLRDDLRRSESTLAAQRERILDQDRALNEYGVVKKKLAVAHEVAARAQGEVAALRLDMRVATEAQNAQAEALERADARTNAVAAELEIKCEALAGFEQRIAERAATIARLTTYSSKRDAEYRQAQEQIERLVADIAIQKDEIAGLHTALAVSESGSTELQTELAEMKDLQAETALALKENQAHSTDLQRYAERLQESIGERERETTSLKVAAAERESNLRQLQAAHEDLLEQLAQKDEAIARKAAALAGLEERMTQRQEMLDRQQDHERELAAELASRTQALSTLESELSQRDKVLETRSSEIRALEKQRRKLHEERERLAGELESQNKALAGKDTHIAHLDTQLKSKAADIAALESELFAATRAETVRIRELLSLIDEKSETLAAAASG